MGGHCPKDNIPSIPITERVKMLFISTQEPVQPILKSYRTALDCEWVIGD